MGYTGYISIEGGSLPFWDCSSERHTQGELGEDNREEQTSIDCAVCQNGTIYHCLKRQNMGRESKLIKIIQLENQVKIIQLES